jgi:hypothetical protein
MIPQGIAVEPMGTLVVTTRLEPIGVLRIDRLTGNRDVLAAFPAHISAFSFLGPLPRGIAVEADARLVVAEAAPDNSGSRVLPPDFSFALVNFGHFAGVTSTAPIALGLEKSKHFAWPNRLGTDFTQPEVGKGHMRPTRW